MLGRTKLTLPELRALVAEIEVVINDRPISVVTSDLTEEPITPSHLMYGRRMSSLPYDIEAAEADLSDPSFGEGPNQVAKRVHRLQKIKATFWKRWSREYLTSLREHHQKTRGVRKLAVKVGDVVLIHEDGPRIDWKMAVIEKLIVSEDGQVRAAEIRTANGKTNRPLAKLYPLEITENSGPEELSSASSPTETSSSSSRVTRKAAMEAKEKIRIQSADSS